jgi:hypothetical protein
MTVASPLNYPGSRVVAGWWRQLAPLQPHALGIGHFLLQRVEALVEVSRPLRIDAFARLVLQALTLPGSRTLHGLEARLHIGTQVILRVLRSLEAEELALPAAEAEWIPAPRARQALDQQSGDLPCLERRLFHFISDWPEPGGGERPPHYINLAADPATPVLKDLKFDPILLTACVQQPTEWKTRHAFPTDIRSVLIPAMSGATPARNSFPEWQNVILIQPEHLLALLALHHTQAGDERLLGFGIRPEGWVLDTAQPALELGAGWQEPFPDLAADLPLSTWEEAWRAWCQPRGLPQTEADSCTLQRQGCRLRVRAPRRLVDRLRAARSDALKGEAWLLAGTGALRSLALLEVVEAEQTSVVQ